MGENIAVVKVGDVIPAGTFIGSFLMFEFSIIESGLLSPFELAIFISLKKFAGIDGKCFPGINALTKLSNCSRSTTKRCILSLEEKGFIQIKRPTTKEKSEWKTSRYSFLVHECMISSIVNSKRKETQIDLEESDNKTATNKRLPGAGSQGTHPWVHTELKGGFTENPKKESFKYKRKKGFSDRTKNEIQPMHTHIKSNGDSQKLTSDNPYVIIGKNMDMLKQYYTMLNENSVKAGDRAIKTFGTAKFNSLTNDIRLVLDKGIFISYDKGNIHFMKAAS